MSLTMCSKRTRRMVKTFRIPRDSLTVNVLFASSAAVRLLDLRTKKFVNFYIRSLPILHHQFAKIGNLNIPMSIDTEEYSMNLYFDDQIEGLKTATDYFCSFFDQEICGININSSLNFSGPMIVIEWLLERQKRFTYIRSECEKTNDTVAKYILDKCNLCSAVIIDFKLPAEFRYNFKFESEWSIEIHSGSWVTLNNLLNINCKELILKGTQLTNNEINSFLKHWFTSDLKFQMVKIDMEVLNLNVLFSGLPFYQNRENIKRVFKALDNGSYFVSGGLDIIREDRRMRATITLTPTLQQQGTFWMFVSDNASQ
uniref:FBA_2 domain-containing protein n=1 Tax=Caenorhabditis tropicalis TaxID=1561998 RepID=A0A1I7V0U0_9PELO